MNFPCGNKTDCNNPAGDNALANTTAELPDKLTFFSIYYPPTGRPGFPEFPGTNPVGNLCISEVSQQAADLCATQPEFPSPGSPTIFANDEQQCSINCSDGSVATFTTPAGLFYTSTLANSNAQAQQFACTAANSFCSTPRPTNAEQTCDYVCEDSSISSYTVAAGAFMGATQADADALAYSFACLVASILCGGGSPPTLYSSTSQSCTVSCGSTTATVTVPAGSALGLTQAEANASAQSLACALATLSCSNVPEIFSSTTQTCTQDCRGFPLSYTVPAGAFFGVDQNSANFAAFAFACQAVALACSTGNPVPPITVGNTPQICPIACPNGGTFVFTLGAGEVRAESQAAANAQAASIACLIGQQHLVCLESIVTSVCVNTAYSDFISATAETGPIVKTGGTLPPGLSLSDGILSGTPTTVGEYSFTVQAQAAYGYVTRSYTISVVGIVGGLPAATVNDPYVAAISTVGFSSPTFSIVGGSLPSGLTMSSSGVISGTPDTDGGFSFVVQATDGANTCTAAMSITVASTDPGDPQEWFKLDEAGGQRVGSIAGTVLDVTNDPVPSAPGLIDVAADLVPGTEILFALAGNPLLGYAGAGFDAMGWIKPVAFSTSPFDEFNLVAWQNADTSQYKFQVCAEPWTGGHPAVVGPPCFRIIVRGDGPFISIIIPTVFVPGAWYFWRVFYDTSLGKFGAQINNGPVAYSTVTPFSAFTNGGWAFISTPFGPGEWLYDETGIWPRMLTDDEVAFVYNSGAGRTYP